MSYDPPTGQRDDERMIEEVLRHAAPRPQPSSAARERTYNALREEWQALSRRRRQRQRAVVIGLAASVLLAVGVGIGLFDAAPPADSAPFASILLTSGDDIELNGRRVTADDEAVLAAGDRLATGRHARVAVRWHDSGSMRIDGNSRIEVLADDRVRLLHGTLYFDSLQFGSDGATASRIEVQTPVGLVRHHGTQFLASTDGGSVTVSVREGRVRIEGATVDVDVNAGQAITVDGNGRFSRSDVEPYAARWQWAAEVAPAVQTEGRRVDDMLNWIGRETGRTIHYGSDEARQDAANEPLIGLGSKGPQQALRAIPVASTQLEYEIGEQRIVVNVPDTPVPMQRNEF